MLIAKKGSHPDVGVNPPGWGHPAGVVPRVSTGGVCWYDVLLGVKPHPAGAGTPGPIATRNMVVRYFNYRNFLRHSNLLSKRCESH